MAGTITPLDQLKSFLNEIFQFETQDLDFGIYKIMHYKRKEIRNFIDKLLVEKVTEQLKTISDDETKSIGLQLKELEKDDVIKGWLAAADSDKATLEKLYPDKFRLYHDLTVKAKDVKVSEETQNLIYNHLTQFFSRYYDKGDFISKRRFGKNEKYVVPYNGEETHFYWANHDQYYIKSSETFQHYAFRVSTHTGTLTVHFKLHNAQLEQGNVKADEPNFFMLAGKSPEIKENDEDLNFILANKKPEIGDHEVTFYFEYRPLDDSEKSKIKGNNKQDTLDEIAFEFLKKEFSANPLFANLWKEQEGKPLLLKKLHHYTRKNKYDFFIHKNLKAFLERELDFYIKTELVNVDDLYVTDTEEHLGRLKHNLRTIKVFKSIADIIIDFVHQIEDFQKKLWEKKKFVISTNWVISIDRLVEYLNNDEKLYRPILEEVVKNKDQVAEWRTLFGDSLFKDWNNVLPDDLVLFHADSLIQLTLTQLKQTNNEKDWLKLPIDTKHFASNFRNKILSVLSENLNLEENADGLVIESDNFQGLRLIYSKFYEKISTIYIDPPYNSGGDDFIYKDSFRNSSWLSMLANRIPLARDLLVQDGLFFTSIDDKDPKNKVTHRLSNLLESQFGPENYIENVIWVKNTTHNDARTFSHNHEYIQTYTKEKNYAIQEHEIFRRAKPGYLEVQELIHKLNKEFPSPEKISEELRKLYRKQEEDYKSQLSANGIEWNDETKRNNPWKGIKQYKYAEYRTTEGKWVSPENARILNAKIWVFRESDPSWPNANTLSKEHKDESSPEYRFYRPKHPVSGKQCPAPGRGWLWRFMTNEDSETLSFEEMEIQKRIHYGEDESKVPQLKRFLDSVTTDVAKSTITDFTDGEKELANIVGERGTFPNPKPTTIIRSLLSLSSKRTGYVLDFFAGSGTTAHSTLQLNYLDNRELSFILQDMEMNIYQTIVPRIKKIAYSFDWKDGKPKDGSMNGLGIFFKYQRLEQYEEALENIAFNAPADAVQKALEFDHYIPKYFLEFETKESNTLVNTEAMKDPWDYRLKVWDGFTYDTEMAVDLVETFNYLIGLHMQKCITKEINGRMYQFIYGNNNANKKILVIWRNVKGWTPDDYTADSLALKKELANYKYDLLYINDQAHIDGYQPIEEVFKNKMLN